MTTHRWSAVDDYITGTIVPSDPMLDAALAASDEAGLPSIHVSPAQGKFLHLLARMQGARAILEIGTLAGYSTIWLARALPEGGRLVTLEANAKHAEVARANLQRAGLAKVVDLRVGPALETLKQLVTEGHARFDLVFIDADKPSTPDYFALALQLAHAGSVIIADNVVRSGALVETANTDPGVQGARRFHEMLAAEPRVSATTVQTVGSKGYDGFTLALVV